MVFMGLCGRLACLCSCFGGSVPIHAFGLTSLVSLRRWVGVVIGLIIIAFLIREVGWTQLEHSLGMLGWGYAVVIIYPISWILLNTGGWRMALHAQFANIPLLRLAQI